MKQLNLFIELIRIKKPIGYMLLFWPCAWGLTLAYDFSNNLKLYLFYLMLFFFGAVLMRSAGCIVNDIFDRKFDAKVSRTKNRPIASGKVSVITAIIYSVILCLLALTVLLNFNQFTILIALGSMPLAFSYPLMKRFTYWPQLFLGITFNYGIILGWTSINPSVGIQPTLVYLGAIFWTLGYDTIYGFQDLKDDEIIGVKSTSLMFKKNPYRFLYFCYFIFILSLVLLGILSKMNFFYYFFLILIIFQMFYFQIKKLNIDNEQSCLKIFKSNNFLGLVIFFTFIIGKIN
jgi:4-hydroxybenzoate polyprenyltransferase